MLRYFLLFLCITSIQGFAQSDYAPFIHGVASGDPLTDKVIIWSRITEADLSKSYTVNWRIAIDTSFSQLIKSGSVSTDSNRDFTIKVDVGGLSENSWYYYDFEYLGKHSIVGRTKTLAAKGTQLDQMRFAIAACSNYSKGYFNSYGKIAERNDIDLLIHLGDYIYNSDNFKIVGREPIPPKDLESLSDFRLRYGQYRTDNNLIYAHQQYPWISVWDDHEFSDDAWQYGSEDITDSTYFSWLKGNAIQAWHEWLPVRHIDSTDRERIYRSFRFGDLIDLSMLDTRIEGRSQQVDFSSPAILDTSRTLLGKTQYNWLKNSILDSDAKWHLLGNQVIMTYVEIGNPINNDQWDGYPIERAKLLQLLEDSSIQNLVVLTGDFHRSASADIPLNKLTYDSLSGAGSVAVEFVTPAIATKEGSEYPITLETVRRANNWVRWAELAHNGYLIIDVDENRVQGDHYLIETAQQESGIEYLASSYKTDDGSRKLSIANGPSIAPSTSILQAPSPYYSPVTGIRTAESANGNLQIKRIYPNPVDETLNIEIYLKKNENVLLKLIDIKGKQMIQEEHFAKRGSTHINLDLKDESIPTGHYLLQIIMTNGEFESVPVQVVK